MSIKIIEHPLYTSQKPNYTLWRDLVEGAGMVEGQGVSSVSSGSSSRLFSTEKPYLIKSPYEPVNQFNIRLWLSTYRNYAMPIVSVFSSSIWRHDPIRELPDILLPYVDDIDGNGTSANSFFYRVTRNTAKFGAYFVFVDLTKTDGSVKTIAQTKTENIRPFCVDISPLNVIRWGYDASGVLDYVVIVETYENESSPFDPTEINNRYRILFKDRWELYDEISQNNELVLSDSGSYSLNTVPVIDGYFEKKYPMIGDSCIAPIASLCLHAYRVGNVLDKSLYDTAFPLQIFKGFSSEDIDAFIRSSSNGLAGPPDCDSYYIEPSGRSFADLRQAIYDDSIAIKEIALRMIRPDSKAGMSAESKKEDRRQLDSQLSVFSRNMEDIEYKTWALMLKWLGRENEIDKIKITYNRDFDINELSGDMLRVLQDMRKTGDISRGTYWNLLKQAEVPFTEDFDPDEENVLIENELRQLNYNPVG
jgi:hypothetical protein